MGTYITCTVNEVASMLGVNDETVRRWIREGKLTAERRLGRSGSSITMENIVAFANQPPRNYIEPLILWLNDHNIAYSLQSSKKEAARSTTAAAATIAGTAALGFAVGGPIGAIAGSAIGTGAGFAIGAANKPYIVLESDYSQEHTHLSQADDQISSPEESVTVPISGTAPSTKSELDDIEAKIVEEQIKLIRLKQEFAQISAKISICEGQIEFYKLLLEKK